MTILQTRGNRNTADTTKEKGVQKQKSISQTCLYCFSKLAKGHISSPGLREGQKINKQKQTKTAVLSPFPTGGVAHFWLFTCLLTVLHNTPLGIWFTTSKQLTYKTYGARDGFIWFCFCFCFLKKDLSQCITSWSYAHYALICWPTKCKINPTSKWCRVFKYSADISGIQKVQVRSHFWSKEVIWLSSLLFVPLARWSLLKSTLVGA